MSMVDRDLIGSGIERRVLVGGRNLRLHRGLVSRGNPVFWFAVAIRTSCKKVTIRSAVAIRSSGSATVELGAVRKQVGRRDPWRSGRSKGEEGVEGKVLKCRRFQGLNRHLGITAQSDN
jgi:hypothetical protein